VAAPAIEPLEQELYNLLSPANFKPLRLERDLDNKRLRERISVEMVFRGLYHFARAFLRGEATDVVVYFKSKAKLLGLVKARRKRHRDLDAHTQLIWGCPSLS